MEPTISPSPRLRLLGKVQALIESREYRFVCHALDAALLSFLANTPTCNFDIWLSSYRQLLTDVRDWVVYSNGGDVSWDAYMSVNQSVSIEDRLALIHKLRNREHPPKFNVLQPGTMQILWSVEDVKHRVPRLTNEQAHEVLATAIKNHDCNEGIGWVTLDTIADCLYPAPEGV